MIENPIARLAVAALLAGWLLGPAWAAGPAAGAPASAETLELKVENLWCPSCSYIVRKVLIRTPGVISAVVSGETGLATVVYDPGVTDAAALGAATAAVGFPSRPTGR